MSRAFNWQDIKAVAFDFDNTITGNLVAGMLTTGCIAEQAFNQQFVREHTQAGVIDFMQTLMRSGKKVYITSYSDPGFSEALTNGVSGEQSIRRWLLLAGLTASELESVYIISYYPALQLERVDTELDRARVGYINSLRADLKGSGANAIGKDAHILEAQLDYNKTFCHNLDESEIILYDDSQANTQNRHYWTRWVLHPDFNWQAERTQLDNLLVAQPRQHADAKSRELDARQKQALLVELIAYKDSWKPHFLWWGPHHKNRAQAVYRAIMTADSVEKIEAILLNQQAIMQGLGLTVTRNDLLDPRWSSLASRGSSYTSYSYLTAIQQASIRLHHWYIESAGVLALLTPLEDLVAQCDNQYLKVDADVLRQSVVGHS